MDNVTFFTDELNGDVHAIIEHEDGSFTSMLKSTYDEMIAQSEAKVI